MDEAIHSTVSATKSDAVKQLAQVVVYKTVGYAMIGWSLTRMFKTMAEIAEVVPKPVV